MQTIIGLIKDINSTNNNIGRKGDKNATFILKNKNKQNT